MAATVENKPRKGPNYGSTVPEGSGGEKVHLLFLMALSESVV